MTTASQYLPADGALDALFGALADSTRRAILLRLAQGPAPIGELAKPFDMSLAAVGKHVRVLEASGLVRRQIVGRLHVCALEPDALRTADGWLEVYRDYWTSSLDALADYVRSMDEG